MKRKLALHRQLYTANRFGGFTNTTVCNRVRNGTDYNVADADADVTCSFCLAIMADKARYARVLQREVKPGSF